MTTLRSPWADVVDWDLLKWLAGPCPTCSVEARIRPEIVWPELLIDRQVVPYLRCAKCGEEVRPSAVTMASDQPEAGVILTWNRKFWPNTQYDFLTLARQDQRKDRSSVSIAEELAHLVERAVAHECSLSDVLWPGPFGSRVEDYCLDLLTARRIIRDADPNRSAADVSSEKPGYSKAEFEAAVDQHLEEQNRAIMRGVQPTCSSTGALVEQDNWAIVTNDYDYLYKSKLAALGFNEQTLKDAIQEYNMKDYSPVHEDQIQRGDPIYNIYEKERPCPACGDTLGGILLYKRSKVQYLKGCKDRPNPNYKRAYHVCSKSPTCKFFAWVEPVGSTPGSSDVLAANSDGYTILIDGVDVSGWLLPGTLKLAPGELPGSTNCTFALRNTYDAFILTPVNTCGGEGEPHEAAKLRLMWFKKSWPAEYSLAPDSCILHRSDAISVYRAGERSGFYGGLIDYTIDDDYPYHNGELLRGRAIAVRCSTAQQMSPYFDHYPKAATPDKQEAVEVKGKASTPTNPHWELPSDLGVVGPPEYPVQFSSTKCFLELLPNDDDILILSLPHRGPADAEAKVQPVLRVKRWGEVEVVPGWRNRMDETAMGFWRALAHVYQALPLPVSAKQEAIIKFCREHRMTLAEFDLQYYAKPYHYSGECVEIDAWEIVTIADTKPVKP
jgi:hypothetical protein